MSRSFDAKDVSSLKMTKVCEGSGNLDVSLSSLDIIDMPLIIVICMDLRVLSMTENACDGLGCVDVVFVL